MISSAIGDGVRPRTVPIPMFMLFGTAKITRRYPERVGLPDDLLYGKKRWFVEMFYPVLQSCRTKSSLAPGGRTHALEEVDPGVTRLAAPIPAPMRD